MAFVVLLGTAIGVRKEMVLASMMLCGVDGRATRKSGGSNFFFLADDGMATGDAVPVVYGVSPGWCISKLALVSSGQSWSWKLAQVPGVRCIFTTAANRWSQFSSPISLGTREMHNLS